MATSRPLSPLLRGQPHLRPLRIPQRRTFFPNPFDSALNPLNASSAPQTLSATRTLPYPSQPIYSIVSDVASYSLFLPYCSASTVTRWSRPDPTYNRKWPSEAQLVVGFSNFTETFTSRVFCVPGSIVESIGGGTETDLQRGDIAHHLEDGDKGAKGAGSGLMTHLRSRWTMKALGKERTEVTLALEFAFANPLYTALSAGAAPKVADVMIKAFEERVKSLMEKNPDMAHTSLSELEGSSLKS